MAQGFPEAEGRRVLVVEDDPARRNTLYKNLHNWNYPVRMCKRAQDALNLIRREKEEFHILITASNVSDMDGFTFVEQVRHLKPDLPIIILMSRDGDMNKIRKMVELGGCDILWKPIRVHHGNNNNNNEAAAEGHTSNSTAVGKGKEAAAASHKRKGKEVVAESALTVKKQRLSWTNEPHLQFVEAVDEIGLEKASPKKILAYMNVEGLSRVQVSNHLKKYRDYEKKKGKKKEAAAADNGGAGPSSQSHFQPQQWNALSHNPTRDKAGVSSNSLQEYLLNSASDDDTMEQELAAAFELLDEDPSGCSSADFDKDDDI